MGRCSSWFILQWLVSKPLCVTRNSYVLHKVEEFSTSLYMHINNSYVLLCSCTVDGRTRRRTPSGELKDHFPSDGSEQTTTTSGVEEELHNIRKKAVGTSVIDDSRKKPAGKRVCFSTSPGRKPKPLSSSPSKKISLGAKQQRISPKKKSTAPLSPLKSGGEGGRTVRERARSYSDGTVRFNLVILYSCMQGCI